MANIPKSIIDVAKKDMPNAAVEYLGVYKGNKAYMLKFPKDYIGGFGMPFVYILNNGKVQTISSGYDKDLLSWINEH